MLIFDQFRTQQQADEVAKLVCRRFATRVDTFVDPDLAADAAAYPYQLVGCVLLVPRQACMELEERIIDLVESKGGNFAGT